MQKTIRIGTRKSKLALVQTHMLEKMILEAFPDLKIEICEMSTKGDELLDRSLLSFGGKGVFTQELEAALLQGQIDLAVHSAKDMPMEFPEGLGIGAVLRRGPVEDVIVTKDGTLLKDLKPGSVVGTGSLRRELQIKKINPLIRVKLIRGNVQTRLRKLEEGQYDAIVLAAAGLDRLELSDENQWKFEHLSSEVCLPAAGQAILAVESRNGDLREVLNAIHDKCAWIELCAERAFLKAIGGSCNAPAAGLAHLDENGILMICDEVQCGMGRTGSMFAWQGFGVKPDILTMAKAIGNGIPVGAFAMTEEVAKYSLQPGDHGATYGGNPLACTAVKTVIKIFERDHIVDHVNAVAPYLTKRLDELVEELDCVTERKGKGLMQGIVVTKPLAEVNKRAIEE